MASRWLEGNRFGQTACQSSIFASPALLFYRGSYLLVGITPFFLLDPQRVRRSLPRLRHDQGYLLRFSWQLQTSSPI